MRPLRVVEYHMQQYHMQQLQMQQLHMQQLQMQQLHTQRTSHDMHVEYSKCVLHVARINTQFYFFIICRNG